MPQVFYSAEEYAALQNDCDLLKRTARQVNRLNRCMSVEAQIDAGALLQVWDLLGVTNQTECVLKLKELLNKE